jgi:CHU_C Type IX secretion signal domain
MNNIYSLFLVALLCFLTGCGKKDSITNLKCCNDINFKTVNPNHKLLFLLPNAITPNNDGRNDQFIALVVDTTTRPSSQAVFSVKKIKIYTLDNHLVYENNNYLNNFDGHDGSGREISEGTYRYELELDDNTATGNLCIIRSQKPCPCRLIDPEPNLPTCYARPSMLGSRRV